MSNPDSPSRLELALDNLNIRVLEQDRKLEQLMSMFLTAAAVPPAPPAPAPSSTVEVAVPAPRLSSALKVQQAARYAGERSEDVDAWLFSLSELFNITNTSSDELKIQFAGQCLEKKALVWYRAKRESTCLTRITTWDAFKSGIKAQFQPIDKVEEAKEELLRLEQKGTLRDFTERFLHLATIVPDMRDEDLLTIFKAGLKGKVRLEVRMKKPTNLADALSLAELYDSGLRVASSRVAFQPGTEDVGDPMEINAMSQPPPRDVKGGWKRPTQGFQRNGGTPSRYQGGGKTLSPAERDRRVKENLCFTCGSPDHQSRHCGSKQRSGAGNGQQPAQGGR